MRTKFVSFLIMTALVLSLFGVISAGYAATGNTNQGASNVNVSGWNAIESSRGAGVSHINSFPSIISTASSPDQNIIWEVGGAHPPQGPPGNTYGPNNFTQQVVNSAPPHSTIYLEPGTYNLQIYVNHPLNIIGLGTSTESGNNALFEPSVVKPLMKDPDTGTPEVPIILVNNTSGVNIQNIAVDGLVGSSQNYAYITDDFVGILFYDSSGTVSGNEISDMYFSPPNYGMQSGEGIFVQTSSGQVSNVNIQNNVITNYQKGGITANDPGTSVMVIDNIISPLAAAQTVIASNGVQIGFGASGVVSGNTITGNSYLIPPYFAIGILGYLDSGLTITDNSISGNAVGILNYGTVTSGPPGPPGPPGQPPNSGVFIRGNTLAGNTYEGIEADQPGATISQNTISGSFIGIAVISYYGDTLNVNANINSNVITSGVSTSIAEAFYDALWSPSTLTQSTGILAMGDNTNTEPLVSLTGNTISNEGLGVMVTTSPSSSSPPTLNANGNTFTSNEIQYVDTTDTTNIQQIIHTNFFDRSVIVSTSNPGNPGPQPPGPVPGSTMPIIWSQIGNAVANASSGDTVLIGPGNYVVDSPIIITEDLTIEPLFPMGPGPQPPGPGPGTGPGPNAVNILVYPSESVGPGQPRSAFQIGGTDDPEANAGSGVFGPVVIQGLNFEGAGIEVPGTGASSLTIQDNTFTDLFKEAIGYHGNSGLSPGLGEYIDILGNYINGTGMPSGYNDIFIGNVFNSEISDNYIIYSGHGGIILTGASQGDEGYNTISHNFVKDIPNEGIQVAFGTNDIVSYNVVINAGEAASVAGRDAAIALFNPDQSNIVISYNLLQNSYEGVGFDQAGTSYSSNAMGSGISITYNDLINNVVDVYNGASSTLSATNNYWGSPSGPTQSEVSGPVNYIPWLTHPVPVPPPPPPAMVPHIQYPIEMTHGLVHNITIDVQSS